MGEEFKNYQANSDKLKPDPPKADVPEKKIEKAITGVATVKKKSEIKKFTDVFISEDAGSIKSYILMDVLVPAIKKAVSDIVTDGISMILYGTTRGKGGNNSNNTTRISYNNYSNKASMYSNQNDQPRARTGFEYDDILFNSKGQAEEALDQMEEIIKTYHMVSIADMYDVAGLTAFPSTYNKYGWKDISSAVSCRVQDGYIIKMPRAIDLN
jgi:hypothetical protein